MFLIEWRQRRHVQRRNVDSKTIEWKIADKKWLQTYLTEPFTDVSTNGAVKSFDELIDESLVGFY